MELIYKPDCEEACNRIQAFWEGEILDRPLINITAPNGQVRKPTPPPPTLERKVLDFDYRLTAEEEEIRCTWFGGEAFPTVWPDFGPSITAGCLGGRLQIAPGDGEQPLYGAVWSYPVIEDWDRDFPRIGFDPENSWFRRSLEFVRLAAQRGKGKYFQVIPDVDGGADTCADLRGADRLCVDLYENPAWVQQLLETVRRGNAEIVNRLYAEVAPYQGGCVSTFRLWAPGRFYNMRSDLGYLISPSMFRRIFLPAMIEEARMLDYTLFHCHSEDYDTNRAGRQAWLDVVLSIPGVDGVQWPRWKEDYPRIIAAGKFVLADVKTQEIPRFVREMGPDRMSRIWMLCTAKDREEGENIIKFLRRK